MDEDLKGKIELEVRRILAEEDIKLSREISEQVDKHRSFLQTQFKTLTWSIGIIFIFATGIFGWLFGKSYERTREQMIQQVKTQMIEFQIVEEHRKQLETQLDSVINKVNKELDDTAELLTEKVKNASDEFITKNVTEKIRALKNLDIKEMVNIAMESYNEIKLEFYDCGVTGFLNSWDQVVDHKFPEPSVVVGMYSQHWNQAEDRRFKLYYCKIRIKPI